MHLILDDIGLTRCGKGWALVGISVDVGWSFRTIVTRDALEQLTPLSPRGNI